MKHSRLFIIIFALTFFAQAYGQQVDLTRCRDWLKKGRGKEVLNDLRGYVAANPKSIDGWALLGEAFLQAGIADSAEAAGRKAISIDDEKPAGYIVAAKALVMMKRNPDAYAILRKGLKNKPNDAKLLSQYGQTLLASDSTDRAIVLFTQAKDADPNSFDANKGLADAYMKQSVYSMACIQYEKCLELDSNEVDLRFKLGKAYMKEKRYGEAMIQYQRVVAADSSNADATVDLAKLYMATKQPQTAAQLFEQYVKLNPANAKSVYPIYMDALYQSAQWKELVPVAERVLADNPKLPRAIRYTARAQFALKNTQKAVDAYLMLEQADTLQLDDVRQLASSYIEQKNDSLAAIRLEQALAKDSTLNALNNELGNIYMRMKLWDKAAAAFQKRFTKDSTAFGAMLNYALCNMVLQNFETAQASLERVIGIKPDYAIAHLYLAQCLVQRFGIKEAKKTYEQFLKLTEGQEEKFRPTDLAEGHRMVGVQFLIDKAYPKALDELNKAIKMNESDIQAHLWKGQTLQSMGKKDEACREYKKVLQLDSKNKEAKKGIEVLDCK